MREMSRIIVTSRRAFIVSAAAVALVKPLLAIAEEAVDSDTANLDRSEQFQDIFAKITGNGTPGEEKITVELPELAENGNFVPITISVDSPMTETDYVKTIYLLSTANPVALVATFHLLPINGLARVQTRMRLAKTQDVITLGHFSGGSMYIATTRVKVTIGGCAG